MPKKTKEWRFSVPWGKLAVVSWGNPKKTPVLLLHGYMDTAATFAILVEQLPDNFYYVGVDLPGHGKSDPLPPGILAGKIHMVEALRQVVDHLSWSSFIFIGHSMGCVIGLAYNQIFPNRMSKIVFMDPGPPLAWYDLIQNNLPLWYNIGYRRYYDSYKKLNSSKPKLYTYDKAISLVVVNRRLTEDQAETVLSRSLVPMGIDTYKMSFDPRMRSVLHVPVAEDTLYTLLTSKMPPALCIEASEPSGLISSKHFADNLLTKSELTLQDFDRVTVTGGHDFHITIPDIVAPIIGNFLRDRKIKRSKL